MHKASASGGFTDRLDVRRFVLRTAPVLGVQLADLADRCLGLLRREPDRLPDTIPAQSRWDIELQTEDWSCLIRGAERGHVFHQDEDAVGDPVVRGEVTRRGPAHKSIMSMTIA